MIHIASAGGTTLQDRVQGVPLIGRDQLGPLKAVKLHMVRSWSIAADSLDGFGLSVRQDDIGDFPDTDPRWMPFPPVFGWYLIEDLIASRPGQAFRDEAVIEQSHPIPLYGLLVPPPVVAITHTAQTSVNWRVELYYEVVDVSQAMWMWLMRQQRTRVAQS